MSTQVLMSKRTLKKTVRHEGQTGTSYQRMENEGDIPANPNRVRTANSLNSQVSLYTEVVTGEEVLDQKFESLEYDTPEVPALKIEMAIRAQQNRWKITILRYILLFFIGFAVGSIATLIDILTTAISSYKFLLLQHLYWLFTKSWSVLIPGFVWCGINVGLILIAACFTVFIAPAAAGSGIPQVKCYLNGLNVPLILRAETMIVKALGVVLAVCGGLLVGKEGPMIQIGAVVAAGLSQGRITWFSLSSSAFQPFRNDAEKRDFINAGAAAGVAAAFGAPVGGVLFTLEEGASFIFQRLTWNTLFTSMVSMFTLVLYRSVLNGHPFTFTPGGLVSFGMFEKVTSYNFYEMLIFVLMGAFGGLIGAAFVALNKILSIYRRSYVKKPAAKILDAVLISLLTTAVAFTLLNLLSDCRSVFQKSTEALHQVGCADGEYNRVGNLLFTTPAMALQALFHDPPGSFSAPALVVLVVVTFCLTCLTYGISVPCGLFIPSLLLGAAWGRTLGDWLHLVAPGYFPEPSKFALIGAAAQLGGVVRMIVSLTVVLMEATGNVILGLPVLFTLIAAKYVGDIFTEGIYDMHISLSGMALVPWEVSAMSVRLRALDVMSTPAVVLEPQMTVGALHELVFHHPHHAFPVVEGPRDPGNFVYGRLVGLMPAHYIALMIKKKIYVPTSRDDEEEEEAKPKLTANDFDDSYPRFYKLKDVLLGISDEEFNRELDFRPYMNRSPYSVSEDMSMPRVFALFRRLGLRHLPVVDSYNQVRGMITRKDLCRFRIAPTGQIAERLFSRFY